MASKEAGETMVMGIQSEQRARSIGSALEMIRTDSLTTGEVSTFMLKFIYLFIYFHNYLLNFLEMTGLFH